MPNDRVDAALTLIAVLAGEDDKTRVENDLRKFNLATVDQSLSIGGFRGLFKAEPETYRRSMVRAVLLVKLSKGTVQLAQGGQQMTTLLTKNTGQLEHELLSLLPYKPYRGNFEKRKDWAQVNFTNPSNHSQGKYMYLVHTLTRDPSKVATYSMNNQSELENYNNLKEKYKGFATETKTAQNNLFVDFMAQYLANPNIVRSNIISSSVISEAKHATYYPLGFTMSVPPECIYITSPKDVAVKNRTTDIIGEFKTKGRNQDNSILSPQEILNQTTGVAGSEHYNEIVVVGTAPEGKQVTVNGLFVKTDGKGNLYIRQGQKEPYVNANTVKLLNDCAKKFSLPIVAIPDTTSAASTVAWPFHGTQDQVIDQKNTRWARTNTI